MCGDCRSYHGIMKISYHWRPKNNLRSKTFSETVGVLFLHLAQEWILETIWLVLSVEFCQERILKQKEQMCKGMILNGGNNELKGD